MSTASRLVTPSEAADLDDRAAWLDRVVLSYLALTAQLEVTGILASRAIYYEVPFSLLEEGGVVRPAHRAGVQDGTSPSCARPEHQAQADVYRRAIEAVFPGSEVVTTVVYAA